VLRVLGGLDDLKGAGAEVIVGARVRHEIARERDRSPDVAGRAPSFGGEELAFAEGRHRHRERGRTLGDHSRGLATGQE
jgi:hypothetical protein